MIYKLHKNKNNNFLTASHGAYTEEYAQNIGKFIPQRSL